MCLLIALFDVDFHRPVSSPESPGVVRTRIANLPEPHPQHVTTPGMNKHPCVHLRQRRKVMTWRGLPPSLQLPCRRSAPPARPAGLSAPVAHGRPFSARCALLGAERGRGRAEKRERGLVVTAAARCLRACRQYTPPPPSARAGLSPLWQADSSLN